MLFSVYCIIFFKSKHAQITKFLLLFMMVIFCFVFPLSLDIPCWILDIQKTNYFSFQRLT
jgi:hypothetical protein